MTFLARAGAAVDGDEEPRPGDLVTMIVPPNLPAHRHRLGRPFGRRAAAADRPQYGGAGTREETGWKSSCAAAIIAGRADRRRARRRDHDRRQERTRSGDRARSRCARARVWQAWSDPACLKQWWCPKPWVTEVKAFDFRPAAPSTPYDRARGPSGGESDNPGLFLEIRPMERIVCTSMLVEGWRPAAPWIAITSIFLMEDAGAGTRFTARCISTRRGATGTPRWASSRAGAS